MFIYPSFRTLTNRNKSTLNFNNQLQAYTNYLEQ